MSTYMENTRYATGVTIAVPCFNEATTIGKVVTDFRRVLPQADIVVFDNASSDETAKVAKEHGARVLYVRHRGKGRVMQRIFQDVNTDFLVIVDGDDTYNAEDVTRLLEPIFSEQADMVVGNRLSYAVRTGFSWSHRVGNIIFRLLLNLLFNTQHNDILSGYRAMNREFYQGIPLLSSGFEVETELTLQALERGCTVEEVNVAYRNRPANSYSKIREFSDGSRIIMTIISLLRDYRPMVFFSLIGSFFLILGIFFGSIIVREYLHTGFIQRVPTAILTIALVLVGVNSFISGLILSAVNRRYREMEVMMRRFKSN